MEAKRNEIKKIALLVSCASVLQIAESLFPHPIPGIRLGLANMITLVALINLGFIASIEITIFRTVISSFILGTFLSPTFMLSLLGGIASTLMMGLFYRLSLLNKRLYLSIIGISLIGAFTHNLVQINLVYLLLIKHKGIFLLLPWLGISSVIMGWVTGLVARQVCLKLKYAGENDVTEIDRIPSTFTLRETQYINGKSYIHKVSAEVKIITILGIASIILFFEYFPIYFIILLSQIIAVIISGISFSILINRFKKFLLILMFSFFIPVFLSSQGEIIFQIGVLKITQPGVLAGVTFAFRIILMMLSASLLIWTTSAEELCDGMSRLLKPFKIIGLSEKRISTILMLSWTFLPHVWEQIHLLIQNHLKKQKKLSQLIPVLSNIITILYLQSDREGKDYIH